MFAKLGSLVQAGVDGVKKLASKAQALAVAAATGVGSMLGMGGINDAHAEVPAIVGTTVTSMTADATSIFTTVFPYAAAVLGMVVVLKLFKRFVSKA